MLLRRALDGLAHAGACLYALLRGLAAVAGVVVGWEEVREAVVVAWNDVVHDVRPGQAAEVAIGAVGGENEPADGRPLRGETVDAGGIAPFTTGNDDLREANPLIP